MMTFNVENLFDTERNTDPNKDDSTYLPLKLKSSRKHKDRCSRITVAKWRRQCLRLDWTDEILEQKLARIADAILQVEGGRGPDVVFLQEVENRALLERLNSSYLRAAGYREIILLEGRDARGINVALLSRLQLASDPSLHLNNESKTPLSERGILETVLRLPDGELLTTYVLHFPSAYHPTTAREQALARLRDLKKSHPTGAMVIAAGDFNISKREERDFSLLARLIDPYWLVTHKLGCKGCKGTYYFGRRDEWSFFDMILAAPSLAPKTSTPATWKVLPCTIRLAASLPDQKRSNGTPQAFNPSTGGGTSDHFPLVVELEAREMRQESLEGQKAGG